MPFLPSPRLWSKRARRRGAAHSGGMSDGGFWETIGDLAFPRWCAGCGEWDEDLCPECVARFSGPWRRVDERAPYLNLVRPASGFTGRFLIDEEVLGEAGVTDFSGYAVEPGRPLLPDLFLD